MDGVTSGLTNRFEPAETTKHLEKVEQFLIHQETNVDYIKDFYRDDFEDYQRLALQRDIVLDEAKRRKVMLNDFQSLLDFIKADEQKGLKKLASEVVKLMRIILTMPVSTCTAERSFSSLRRLKNYLRSTMSQERLNSCTIMHTYSEIVREINLDVLVDEFILKCDTRKQKFALST